MTIIKNKQINNINITDNIVIQLIITGLISTIILLIFINTYYLQILQLQSVSMNPLSVSITLMVIIIIIVHIKHFIFAEQGNNDDFEQLTLSHLHTIPKQHNPSHHNTYHSFYEAYTQTCIGQKTVTMKNGTYKQEALKYATQNDEIVYNCGDDYMLILNYGISKGKWVTNIKLFSLPHMHQAQATAMYGQLQTNLRTSCQLYKSNKKTTQERTYQFIFSIKNSDAWTIQKLNIVANETADEENNVNLSIEPIINMIPSKPIVATVSGNGRIYAYITEDTPWIIDIYYHHKYFYLRKASQINVQFNGPRIFSVGQKYQASTYENYFDMINYNYDYMTKANLHRIGTIIPYKLMISKKNNLIYYIYQHKNHPFCQTNLLMSAAWDISFLNRNQEDEELRESKVIDVYMNSGKVHRHQNDNPVNYFAEDQSKEHKNMQANIIGNIIEQSKQYTVDCQIQSDSHTIFNDSSGVICIYIVTGSNYLRVVQIQKQPSFFIKKEKLTGSTDKENDELEKRRKNMYEEYHVYFQDQPIQTKNEQNETEQNTLNKTKQKKNIKEEIGRLKRTIIPLPSKDGRPLSAEDFNKITILSIENNDTPFVWLSTKVSRKQSYLFIIKIKDQSVGAYKFFQLNSKMRNRGDKNYPDQQQSQYALSYLNRVLQISYIQQKIILFWGWGIEIYELQNSNEQSNFGNDLPMDSLIPLIGLFATVYCMIQFLIPSQ